MTANQTLWARFKKLLQNPVPKTQVFHGNNFSSICGFEIDCGGSINGVEFKCGRPDCERCNPMTPERAAQINERFLKERGYDQPND